MQKQAQRREDTFSVHEARPVAAGRLPISGSCVGKPVSENMLPASQAGPEGASDTTGAS